MSDQFPGRPNPPTTAETTEWWDATREQRLMVQRCRRCEGVQLYPRVICTHCGSLDLALVQASGRGVVYSHTTVEKSANPEFFTAPYIVALVRLEEGPTLLTNIVGADPADLLCDRQVDVTWEALPDGRQLPLFTPTTEQGAS